MRHEQIGSLQARRPGLGGEPHSFRWGAMLPDFLLRCLACGSESVWDTEACPPVGTPEIGHPVLWQCKACGGEQCHIIESLFLVLDKLHHEICLATEIDRRTVDRIMAEVYRCRRQPDCATPWTRADHGLEMEAVAEITGLPRELVGQVAAAEDAWLLRHGYIPNTAG